MRVRTLLFLRGDRRKLMARQSFSTLSLAKDNAALMEEIDQVAATLAECGQDGDVKKTTPLRRREAAAKILHARLTTTVKHEAINLPSPAMHLWTPGLILCTAFVESSYQLMPVSIFVGLIMSWVRLDALDTLNAHRLKLDQLQGLMDSMSPPISKGDAAHDKT